MKSQWQMNRNRAARPEYRMADPDLGAFIGWLIVGILVIGFFCAGFSHGHLDWLDDNH
jgi:hypothetical protein